MKNKQPQKKPFWKSTVAIAIGITILLLLCVKIYQTFIFNDVYAIYETPKAYCTIKQTLNHQYTIEIKYKDGFKESCPVTKSYKPIQYFRTFAFKWQNKPCVLSAPLVEDSVMYPMINVGTDQRIRMTVVQLPVEWMGKATKKIDY